MDLPVTSSDAPLTEEALIADRQHFWSVFTRFVFWAVVVNAVGLALLAIFLV